MKVNEVKIGKKTYTLPYDLATLVHGRPEVMKELGELEAKWKSGQLTDEELDDKVKEILSKERRKMMITTMAVPIGIVVLMILLCVFRLFFKS